MFDLVLDCPGERFHVQHRSSGKVIERGMLASLGLGRGDLCVASGGGSAATQVTVMREAADRFWICVGDGQTCADVKGPFDGQAALRRGLTAQTQRLTESLQVGLAALVDRPLWAEYRRARRGQAYAFLFHVKSKNLAASGDYLVAVDANNDVTVTAFHCLHVDAVKHVVDKDGATVSERTDDADAAAINALLRACTDRVAPGLNVTVSLRRPRKGTNQVQAVPLFQGSDLRTVDRSVKNCVVGYLAALCSTHGFALANRVEM